MTLILNSPKTGESTPMLLLALDQAFVRIRLGKCQNRRLIDYKIWLFKGSAGILSRIKAESYYQGYVGDLIADFCVSDVRFWFWIWAEEP